MFDKMFDVPGLLAKCEKTVADYSNYLTERAKASENAGEATVLIIRAGIWADVANMLAKAQGK